MKMTRTNLSSKDRVHRLHDDTRLAGRKLAQVFELMEILFRDASSKSGEVHSWFRSELAKEIVYDWISCHTQKTLF